MSDAQTQPQVPMEEIEKKKNISTGGVARERMQPRPIGAEVQTLAQLRKQSRSSLVSYSSRTMKL